MCLVRNVELSYLSLFTGHACHYSGLNPYVNLEDWRLLHEFVLFRSEIVVHCQPMTFMRILNIDLNCWMPLQRSNRIVSVRRERLPVRGQLRIESTSASPQRLLLNTVDNVVPARGKQIRPISPRDDRGGRERYGNRHSVMQKSMSPVPQTTRPGKCVWQ